MLRRAAHMPPKRPASSVVIRPGISGWKPILADAVASDGAELFSAHSDYSVRGEVFGTEENAVSTPVTQRHRLIGGVHPVLVDGQGWYLFGRRADRGSTAQPMGAVKRRLG